MLNNTSHAGKETENKYVLNENRKQAELLRTWRQLAVNQAVNPLKCNENTQNIHSINFYYDKF